MDNSVPLVPQNQSSQSLHIQPGMLAQVGPAAGALRLGFHGVYSESESIIEFISISSGGTFNQVVF